jgi:ribosomal protein S18 acetylase RimI-like enzyme
MIEISPLETARFGVLAGKLLGTNAAPEAIEVEARRLGIRILTTRVDSGALSRVHALEQAGYQLMDTLVYFGLELNKLSNNPETGTEMILRRAEPRDIVAVGNVAHAAFFRYIGHYHADPRLDSSAANSAYVEWAETCAKNESISRPVFVAEHQGVVTAFLAMRRNGADEFEICLNAVHPGCHSRGIYSALLNYSIVFAQNSSALRIITSTQINNYAVQRIWCRRGFVPIQSSYTFHKWID